MWRICINTQMQRLLGSRGHRCCPCPIPVQYKSRCACPELKNTPRLYDAQRRRMVHCKEQLAECEPPMACDILNSELNKQQKLSPSTHLKAEFSKRGLVRVARQEPISETVINRISWHRNPNSRNQFRHISVVSRRSKKYRDEKFKNQRTSLPDTLNDFQCRKCMPRIRRGRQRKTTLFDRVLDLLRDKNAQKRVRDLDDAVKQKAKLGMMPSRKESEEYFDCEEPHSGLTDFVENVKAKSKEIKDQLLQGEYADDLAISEDVPYPNKVQKISKEKKLPFEVGLPEEKPSETIEEDYMTLTEYEAEKGMRHHESKLSRQSKPKTMYPRRGQYTSSWLTPRKQRELENLTRYAREMQSKNNLRNEMRDVEPSRKGDLPRKKRERFSSKPKRMTGDEGLESNPMTYSDMLNTPISSVMKQRQHKAKTIGRLKSQWKSCLDSERLLAVRMNHPFPKLMTVEEREKMERHHKDLESAIHEKCKDRLYQNLCEEAGRQFRLGSAQSEQERRENEILRKCQTMLNLDEDVELHETAKSINLLELKRLQDMQQGRREFLNDEDFLSHVLMSQDGDVKSSGGNQCGKDGHGDKEQECEEEPEPCDKSKKDDGEQHEEVTKIVEDLWKKFQKEQQAAQCKEIVEAEEAKKKGESEMLKKCKTVKDKCKDLEMESECAKLKEDKGKKEGKEKSNKEGKKKSKKEGKEKSKKDGNEGKKESKGKGKKENDGQKADKELTKKCEESKSKGPAKKEKGRKSGKSGGEKTKSTKSEGKADKEAQTVVEQIDNIIKQCETIKQNYQQTLSKKKNGDSKKKSAKADKKEEEKKNEEEMLNKCAEADKKKKEQEMKKKCAEAEKKKKEEEKKNEGEMLKKCAEADKKKKEQEMKKKCAEAEKKKEEEEKKKNEGEMLKKCAEAEKKKKEQEMKKKCAEAEKKKEEELKKKCAEAEKKKKEEEMKKKCAEAEKKKEEELKKKCAEAEKKKKEEEMKKKCAEASKKAEEAKKKEAEMMKKCAEAKKKKQEEELKKKKAEADKKKKEEEMKKKCAEAKKLAEAQKKEQELKKKCAEAEKKKQEEELKKKCAEAEKKKKEEELKKKCAEASKKAEEAKKKEAEMLKKCAEAEKKKKEAELKKKCAEAEKKKQAEEAEAKAKAQEDELKKKCAELDKKKKENEQKKKCRVAELKKQCEAITKRQKEAKLAKKNKIKEDQRKLKEAAEQQKRCREMSAKKKKQSEEEECDGDDKSNFTSISGNNDIHGGLFLTPSISNMGGMLNAPHYLDDDFDVPQSSIYKPGLFVDDVNNNSTGSMVVRRHGVVHPSRILPFLVNPFRMLPPSICCNTLTLRHLLPNLTGRRCLADDILMYYWLRQMSHLIVGVGVKSNAIDPLNAVPSIHCSGERCLIGESEAGSPLMWRCLTMGNRYDND